MTLYFALAYLLAKEKKRKIGFEETVIHHDSKLNDTCVEISILNLG